MNNDILIFLRESNAIEGVYDEASVKEAKKAWDYIIRQDVLSIPGILKMHEILMKGKLPPPYLGAFRKCGVTIAGRPGANWELVPDLMNNWVLDATAPDADPMKMHITYEKIHPFVDGNGRTGRILFNWMRLKQGKGILIIYEKERRDYYKWFD